MSRCESGSTQKLGASLTCEIANPSERVVETSRAVGEKAQTPSEIAASSRLHWLRRKITPPPTLTIRARRSGCGNRFFSCGHCPRQPSGVGREVYPVHFFSKHLRVDVVDLTDSIRRVASSARGRETRPQWNIARERAGEAGFTDERVLETCVRLTSVWRFEAEGGSFSLPVASLSKDGGPAVAFFCVFCGERGDRARVAAHVTEHVTFLYLLLSHSTFYYEADAAGVGGSRVGLSRMSQHSR